MQQFVNLEFRWYRDAKGYKLFDEPMSNAAAEAPLTGVAAWYAPELVLHPRGSQHILPDPAPYRLPLRIVRLGGELVPYQPLDILDDIFRAYLNLRKGDPSCDLEKSAEALLDFVDRYGPLTRSGLVEDKGDLVGPAAYNVRLMNYYIDARLADDSAAIRQGLAESAMGITGIVPLLNYDPATRTPKLRFHLPSLEGALWLQLMQSFDSGTSLRRCEWEQCRIVFEAGAGTGRRADSRFCCDQHRIAYHSVHRAPRSADKQQSRRRGRPRLSRPV